MHGGAAHSWCWLPLIPPTELGKRRCCGPLLTAPGQPRQGTWPCYILASFEPTRWLFLTTSSAQTQTEQPRPCPQRKGARELRSGHSSCCGVLTKGFISPPSSIPLELSQTHPYEMVSVPSLSSHPQPLVYPRATSPLPPTYTCQHKTFHWEATVRYAVLDSTALIEHGVFPRVTSFGGQLSLSFPLTFWL